MIPSTQGEDKGTAADTTATHRAPDATAARAESSAPPAESAFDSRAAQDVLALLREWGWERGLAKIKAEIEASESPRKAALQVLLGWLAGERGHHDEAKGQLQAGEAAPALAAWALAGQAVVALRERRLTAARTFLDRAEAAAGDAGLRATTAHLRGAVALHEGRHAEALTWLHAALEGFASSTAARGRSEGLHFGAGRVLDTLGMVHAARNNFPTASAFYTESLAVKRRHRDDAGLALTHGQLGRLMLDWDRLDEADAYFRDGLAISRRIGDEHGEAVLHNQRGRVLLARGRPAEARPLLEESLRAALARWPGVEAYARKDLARALLGLGRLEEAEAQALQAETLFQSLSIAEGLFHVQAALGAIHRAQGRPEDAARRLEDAAGGFERQGEHADAARTLRQLARTHREPSLVVQALLGALDEAERGRRDHLRAPIERELREASEIDWARRELRRRTPAGAETAEREETATVISVEVRADGEEDVGGLMQIRNHLYADLAPVLAEQGAVVVQRRGEGYLALVRGAGHARRGVAAALGLARALAEANRPRRVLGWPSWRLYAGVASGSLCVGEIGSWDRPEWTAAGPAVRQADELRQASGLEAPCVSDEVRRLTASAFAFRSKGPLLWEAIGPEDAKKEGQ